MKLFSKSSSSISDICLVGSRLQDPKVALGQFGQAYFEAAEAYFTKMQTGLERRTRYAEDMVFPALFLFRHATELFLKAIILYSRRIKEFDDSWPKELVNEHSLKELYEMALKSWPGSSNMISKEAADVLAQLHEADEESVSFRYPFNKKYESFWEHTLDGNSADLWNKLKPLGEQLSGQLDGLNCWLSEQEANQ